MPVAKMMTRRAFLGTAASAAALHGAAGPLRLGFSLYGMPEFRPGDALEACGRNGYRAVEFALLDGFPTHPNVLSAGDRRQLAYQLVDLDLTLPSLMEKMLLTASDEEHRRNLEKIRVAAQLGRDLSPNAPPLIETVLGGRPDQWLELRRPMAERLHDWVRVARQLDQVIALKAHVGGAAHLPEHLLWLRSQVGGPYVRFVYDYSHFRLRGLDLETTLDDLLPATAFVHLKDAQGSPDQPQFLLPGDGDTDYSALIAGLRKGGYEGAVVVEVSSQIHSRDDYDALGSAERCHERLAPLFAQDGPN